MKYVMAGLGILSQVFVAYVLLHAKRLSFANQGGEPINTILVDNDEWAMALIALALMFLCFVWCLVSMMIHEDTLNSILDEED